MIHSEGQLSESEEELDVEKKGQMLPQTTDTDVLLVGPRESSASLKSHLQEHINTSSNFLSTSQAVTSLGVVSNQLMSIHEAFATDDVVDDFIKEKQDVSDSKCKVVDLTLPGKVHQLIMKYLIYTHVLLCRMGFMGRNRSP